MKATIDIQFLSPAKMEATLSAMKALSFLTGHWRGKGSSQSKKVEAFDHYEYLEGNYFIQHEWDWDLEGEKFSGKEMIGYDVANQCYFSQMFDNAGHFVTYNITRKGQTLLYDGRFQKAAMLFVDSKLDVHWEFTQDELNWSVLCEISFEQENERVRTAPPPLEMSEYDMSHVYFDETLV